MAVFRVGEFPYLPPVELPFGLAQAIEANARLVKECQPLWEGIAEAAQHDITVFNAISTGISSGTAKLMEQLMASGQISQVVLDQGMGPMLRAADAFAAISAMHGPHGALAKAINPTFL